VDHLLRTPGCSEIFIAIRVTKMMGPPYSAMGNSLPVGFQNRWVRAHKRLKKDADVFERLFPGFQIAIVKKQTVGWIYLTKHQKKLEPQPVTSEP
jgi:hypothetical protein